MIKDTIVFGGLAGAVGNILKETMAWSLYFWGLIKYTFVHFCAGIVINPDTYVKDPLSVVVGIMIDFLIAAIFSLAMYLVMRRTGTDYWVIKGLGLGIFVFLICYGVLRPAISIKIESSPFTALMYIFPNLTYGVATCWFLQKYGTFKVFWK